MLNAKINYVFKDKKLLFSAFYSDKKNRLFSERLEFLGDAVLELIVRQYFFDNYPDLPVGKLSKLKSTVVSTKSLAKIALEINLKPRGVEVENSVLANIVEAIIGAIFLDSGLEDARKFVLSNFDRPLQEASGNIKKDYKSLLQELTHKKCKQSPSYQLLEETGPPHKKTFKVEVFIGGERIGSGFGKSKKEAEQSAANDALGNLNWN